MCRSANGHGFKINVLIFNFKNEKRFQIEIPGASDKKAKPPDNRSAMHTLEKQVSIPAGNKEKGKTCMVHSECVVHSVRCVRCTLPECWCWLTGGRNRRLDTLDVRLVSTFPNVFSLGKSLPAELSWPNFSSFAQTVRTVISLIKPIDGQRYRLVVWWTDRR